MPDYTQADIIIISLAVLCIPALAFYHVLSARSAKAIANWHDALARMPKHDPAQRASKARGEELDWLDSI